MKNTHASGDMSLKARATWPRRARRRADFHFPPQIFSAALSPVAFREGAPRARVRAHLRRADAATDFGPRGREFAARGAGDTKTAGGPGSRAKAKRGPNALPIAIRVNFTELYMYSKDP